jgi:ubiquinone/menaquinone biosynthesis C-methylase UbiE
MARHICDGKSCVTAHPSDQWIKVDSLGPLEYANCGLCQSPDADLLVVQHMFREDFHVVRCRSCGLIRTNPRPSPEWKSRFYDVKYNSWLEELGRNFIYAAEANRLPAYRRLVQFVKKRIRPGGTLIDVGAASGEFVKIAGDEGLDAIACDYSREALESAREKYNIRTLESVAESVDAPDNSFDFVTMLHTIEHLPDPVGVLREMYRIAKPGGWILLETPNYAFHFMAETKLRAVTPLYRLVTGKEGLPWYPFDHYYHWTPMLLRRALQTAGFHSAYSHHFLGYRSTTQPSILFGSAYRVYDLMAQSLNSLSGGRWDYCFVQLATGRK